MLLCIGALSTYRRTVLLKSVDESSAVTCRSLMLSALWSVLSVKLQFVVLRGCCCVCVCPLPSSPLYMTRVEAVAGKVGYNLQKLRLSARYFQPSPSGIDRGVVVNFYLGGTVSET